MAVMQEPDFAGWATKNDLECADGLTIRRDAFKHHDGGKVPLVYQHQHNTPENVLGYAVLENRPEGVYARGYFNNSPTAQSMKEAVAHGDVEALSIFANGLKKRVNDVLHGVIREVSLVLAGANPGAKIDFVRLVHGIDDYEELETEAVIYTDDSELTLMHADTEGDTVATDTETDTEAETGERTIAEIYNEMTDEQKTVVGVLVTQAYQESKDESEDEAAAHSDDSDEEEAVIAHSDDNTDNTDTASADTTNEDDVLEHQEGNTEMANVFEQQGGTAVESDAVLMHSGMPIVKKDGTNLTHSQLDGLVHDVASEMLRGSSSIRQTILAHAEDYGITNIEMLFPDAKTLDARPEWITRKMEWVKVVLEGTRHQPFARIKSRSADLTYDSARAKGYIKGNEKKEQFFAITHRETGPTTIYKKQKLDRDDIIDITDFDVVAWVWGEMRFMLDEEVARAILLGDGRDVDDTDKIDESKIRPIAQDDPFYTDVVELEASVTGEALIEAVIRRRKDFKGQGSPTCFMGEDVLADLLLLKDKLGRRIYSNVGELAAAMRVGMVVPVPQLDEGIMRNEGEVQIILVNLSDYSVGTDKGGEISKFDDFDIDFNQYKYLIEGRMSGALTKHKTAQVFVRASGTLIDMTNVVPSFSDPDITIPTVTGVSYYKVVVAGPNEEVADGSTVTVVSGDTVEIKALADEGYYFPHNVSTTWSYTAA